MTVEIITIGDELLIGQVVDTNSSWMAKILNENGFKVVRKVTVGDDAEDIVKAIDDAMKKVSVVLITGGLGPTKDDITLKTLCGYFDSKLSFSDDVYANIEKLFNKNGRVMNELTRNQALVPDKATVLQNAMGTAPCTWFERDGVVLVSMPGVPYEMKWLMENEIVPRLKKTFNRDLYIRHQTCMVTGYSESALALRLTDFENNMPEFVKLAYLPQMGIIRLRLSAYYDDNKVVEETIDALRKQLEEILEGNIIVEEDKNLEVLVGDYLRAKNLTVGTAESCTGGMIASRLTSVPGSSDYYLGSVVSYANEVKQNLLGVSDNDLDKYGAVSQQVVEEMAKGALNLLKCDYAVSTSGVAGPGGGTPEKPVGTVWIAVANKEKVVSKEYRFAIASSRDNNIQRATNFSLLMLLEELRK
jgi:competence/damage-inducible protein CinA C-terminal domain